MVSSLVMTCPPGRGSSPRLTADLWDRSTTAGWPRASVQQEPHPDSLPNDPATSTLSLPAISMFYATLKGQSVLARPIDATLPGHVKFVTSGRRSVNLNNRSSPTHAFLFDRHPTVL